MQKPKILILPLLYIFFITPSYSEEQQLFKFTGGAPLDSYQSITIIPILKEVFKKMNKKVTFKYNPSLRSLKLSNSGEYDGELHRVYDFHEITNKKYSNLIRIDTYMMSIHLSYFTTIKGLNIKNREDLAQYKVAYYRGRKNVDNLLKGFLPPSQIFLTNNDDIAFKMLSTGRVDIVIAEDVEGLFLIKKELSYSNIYKLKNIKETKIYTYLNKKHSSLLPLINKTLTDMKEDGSYQSILEESQLEYFNRL
ncbi:MAG: transporter substrate-binding domain-containing protein [Spirochaetaceae bacterium]